MTQVSLPRLYALRAAYLLMSVGLGLTIWPGILHPEKPWPLMYGVVQCVLAAVSLLALLGLRHPLKMLPILMFEMIWTLRALSACGRVRVMTATRPSTAVRMVS